MHRIVQLVHIESGEIAARARMQSFGPDYFALVRDWRAQHPEATHIIRFRPRVKLYIDFTSYPTEETGHGQEANDHEGRSQEVRGQPR
jgi:hypothetical protein